MNMEFEKDGWTISPSQAGEQADCVHPEWRALRSRFQAARQAWRLMRDMSGGDSALPEGSFHKISASRLADLPRRPPSVNQTDSGNRNCAEGTFGDGAGMSRTGVRGQ